MRAESTEEKGKFKEASSEKWLEISRDRAREQALAGLKNAKTCALALDLCLLVRTYRAVLEKQDIHDWCSFVSELCDEAGCKEASGLCAKAAEAVLRSEGAYLEFCGQSLKKCSESRRPKRQSPERTTYVA